MNDAEFLAEAKKGWASDFILLILLYSGSCRDILPHRCQTKIVEP